MPVREDESGYTRIAQSSSHHQSSIHSVVELCSHIVIVGIRVARVMLVGNDRRRLLNIHDAPLIVLRSSPRSA